MTSRTLLSLLCILSSYCFAQEEQQPAKRLKIGVALEGGGALGLGHLGILTWLEEHHIPVDYIAGTSMGGLVGGIYATGMSSGEVEQLVKSINWDDTLRGEIPYKDLIFRRKEDRKAFPNSMEFGLRHGLQLPGGINSGQQVGYILDRVALPYSQLKSFDDLPIPFRCVATDLVSGEAHVFRNGSLSSALRATMSIPGLFTPVKTDNKIYVDGGLLNNLPVDVVKQMGADIVIAVYLNTEAYDPKKSQSLLGVVGRSLGVMIAANEKRNMEAADVLISVDLTKFTATDYDDSEEITKRGYEGAQKKAQLLSRFSVDEAAWQRYMAQRESRRVSNVPVPEFVEVRGTNSDLRRDISKELAGHVGKPIDTAGLERDLTRIAGIGRFYSLDYREVRRNGKSGLEIIAQEKDYSPPSLKPWFLVDGSDYKNVRFSLGARITFLDLGGFRSEWRNDITFGSTYAVMSEYYRPFSATSRWFYAPRIFANTAPFMLYDDNKLVAEYRRREAGFGFDIGNNPTRNSELRFGYQWGKLGFSPRIGDPDLFPRVSDTQGVLQVRYKLDRLDDEVIPREGEYLSASFGWATDSPGARVTFPIAEVRSDLFRRVSKPGSVYLVSQGGTTFGRDPLLPQFSLGGPFQLGAYGANELLGNQYFIFRLGYIHEIGRLFPLMGKNAYFISNYEIAKMYGDPDKTKLPASATAGVIVQTAFGPLFLGGAVGDAGHRKFFFQLGRFF